MNSQELNFLIAGGETIAPKRGSGWCYIISTYRSIKIELVEIMEALISLLLLRFSGRVPVQARLEAVSSWLTLVKKQNSTE